VATVAHASRRIAIIINFLDSIPGVVEVRAKQTNWVSETQGIVDSVGIEFQD